MNGQSLRLRRERDFQTRQSEEGHEPTTERTLRILGRELMPKRKEPERSREEQEKRFKAAAKEGGADLSESDSKAR
jgi:hypothetical protein